MIDTQRRRLLQALGAGTALFGTGLGARAQQAPRNLWADPKFDRDPFQLGVASGEPSADGFVIWTRLAPQPLEQGGGMVMRPVPVSWELAEDEGFRKVVRKGSALARPELAHSVHVETEGLAPARPYWYRFVVGDAASPVGRSATLPAAGARVDRVRFAVAGCQHYEEGHFTAWRRIAEEPLDFVFHYGDYIYEGPDPGPGERKVNGRPFTPLRRHVGGEIYSLDDYRRRHALYRSDRDLQAAHAAAPWFVSFDDHEIDNNWAAELDQDGTPAELFMLRRAAAMQAYYEHMPLRRGSMPANGHMRMYRRAGWGDLLQAHFLDTRQYRSDQANGDRDAPQDAVVAAPGRTMLGAEQEAWLYDGLRPDDGHRWHVIAQQVSLANLATKWPRSGDEIVYSMDQWSGYLGARRRLLGHIQRAGMRNVVTVCGDAHRHFASDLLQDHEDSGVVSSEFLATSITSGADGIGEDDDFTRHARSLNPHLKALVDRRGYVVCDVRRDAWHADLKILDRVTVPDQPVRSHARFAIEHGRPGLQTA
ncbi:alkaline phosphatase D family protein [Vulcaniibacterium tengchongense]|uniref:Alkaline phosphatase D n=1 Tax=Vulcaniibacterium tengchongense TaxID=1273429 RepID=A0A3N4V9N5_9GAMM|nr:alkaline phosphatase D family protein [Vulcaniibacterium tengchongense]RPE79706.1 alkaline phosphatase D [Vulcaniibacterium tengchongense]